MPWPLPLRGPGVGVAGGPRRSAAESRSVPVAGGGGGPLPSFLRVLQGLQSLCCAFGKRLGTDARGKKGLVRRSGSGKLRGGKVEGLASQGAAGTRRPG